MVLPTRGTEWQWLWAMGARPVEKDREANAAGGDPHGDMTDFRGRNFNRMLRRNAEISHRRSAPQRRGGRPIPRTGLRLGVSLDFGGVYRENQS
jgi:hypothetical protein